MQIAKEVQANQKIISNNLKILIEKIENSEDLSVGKLKKLLQEAQIKSEELMPWADFEHSPADSYGRNLVYDGGFFEVMVMSWLPQDFSAIHDHGYTEWGAVQIFGPAEHAIFFAQDGEIKTLSRNLVNSGQIVGVGNQLVHQMGNPTEDTNFLSLHIYGNFDRTGDITADARIFDVEHNQVLRTSGGIFFGLPESQINTLEQGFEADFITSLRDRTEQIKRIKKAEENNIYKGYKALDKLIERFFDPKQFGEVVENIEEYLDENHHNTHSAYWKLLNWELEEAAKLQNDLLEKEKNADYFQHYAEVYDEVIGVPCLENFMQGYLKFFKENFVPNIQEKTFLSIGCGTGLVEDWMIKNLGVAFEKLYGIDISEAMIGVASKRIKAEVGDALTLDPEVQMWDLTFCGLNVFQYVHHKDLEDVIQQTAAITKEAGYFIGDFITPDHIRWYPNVIKSNTKPVISIRTPQLVAHHNHMYQRSKIFNIQAMQDKLRITYEGEHERFLPPMSRIRDYFKNAFKGEVKLFDAVSLTPIQENEDTCPSTRYIVIAQKV